MTDRHLTRLGAANGKVYNGGKAHIALSFDRTIETIRSSAAC